MPIRPEEQLLGLIRKGLRPFAGGRLDYDSVLHQVEGAHFILIGEASHGTHEFYKHWAAITKTSHPAKLPAETYTEPHLEEVPETFPSGV
ncbi:MAG TPA: hypothetical protein VGG97_28820 [Bryobacteraceae bacterium]|jgi:hypothetical protein